VALKPAKLQNDRAEAQILQLCSAGRAIEDTVIGAKKRARIAGSLS
jgi:hypothetical protein